jgi:uncharacterized membrane protein
MEHQSIVRGIEFIAGTLEIVGVAIIALAFAHAIARGLLHFAQRKEDAFSRLKIYIGKALQLALEFLVAADVIRTVTIDLTQKGLLLLGLLIVIRTALSWSITVEIEGCWPWQVAALRRAEASKK